MLPALGTDEAVAMKPNERTKLLASAREFKSRYTAQVKAGCSRSIVVLVRLGLSAFKVRRALNLVRNFKP
jgi:hypothetical protein